MQNWIRTLYTNTPAQRTLRGMSRTGLLPERLWRKMAVQRVFRVAGPDRRTFLYASTANDTIGRGLFWAGWQSMEPETIGPFYQLARQAHVVLDIGANTGIFALVACAANPHSKVIAFEPVPRVYQKLVANIHANGWEGRCATYMVAVAEAIGSTQFHVPLTDIPTSASLNVQGFRSHPGTLIDVPVTTIDTMCAGVGRVDLVKIDVEGFEDKVLAGMQRVLAESAPAIVVECNGDGPFAAVDATLRRLGYTFFHLLPEGPRPLARIVPDPAGHYRNFLCLPGAAHV
ncbi:MAG TPA: FkbM family methyltransferase [Chloroflexia bacterium]|nr:FkbM family methyltransferase [Chloroflexia bacterium]